MSKQFDFIPAVNFGEWRYYAVWVDEKDPGLDGACPIIGWRLETEPPRRGTSEHTTMGSAIACIGDTGWPECISTDRIVLAQSATQAIAKARALVPDDVRNTAEDHNRTEPAS